MTLDTTLDGFLNRRITLEQPEKGFRAGSDTVLLAAAVPATKGRVLDTGCGVGGAMLCLAARVPGLTITGVEVQPELAALCRSNITRNALKADLSVEEGDVTRFVASEPFDHVIMNPPYHAEATHDVSPNIIKRTANTEKEGDLPAWIASASRNLKADGILTLIQRSDRQDEILGYLNQGFGRTDVLPLLPKPDAAPKRIIIRAYKGGSSRITQCQPLVLRKSDGGYSDAAEGILRHAKEVAFLGR